MKLSTLTLFVLAIGPIAFAGEPNTERQSATAPPAAASSEPSTIPETADGSPRVISKEGAANRQTRTLNSFV